jgi:hypothetical protein
MIGKYAAPVPDRDRPVLVGTLHPAICADVGGDTETIWLSVPVSQCGLLAQKAPPRVAKTMVACFLFHLN